MPSASNAATILFTAPLGLTESQEVPPTGSPALGTGNAILDTAALTLEVNLSWTALLAPAGAAHIHCCPGPGVSGPVAIDFVPAGFPSAVSGTFNHVFDLTAATSYGGGFLAGFGGDVDAARAAVVTGMLAGEAYFNIHTPVNQPGEIRGDIEQVQPIPEPSTIALLTLGLGGGLAEAAGSLGPPDLARHSRSLRPLAVLLRSLVHVFQRDLLAARKRGFCLRHTGRLAHRRSSPVLVHPVRYFLDHLVARNGV